MCECAKMSSFKLAFLGKIITISQPFISLELCTKISYVLWDKTSSFQSAKLNKNWLKSPICVLLYTLPLKSNNTTPAVNPAFGGREECYLAPEETIEYHSNHLLLPLTKPPLNPSTRSPLPPL